MHTLGQIPTKPRLAPDDPEKAKAAVFEILGYQIHAEEVRDFHLSPARIRITTAPARTSKSMSAAADLIAESMPTIPLTSCIDWIVGTDYPTNKEFAYCWEWLVEKRERWPFRYEITTAHNTPSQGNMRIVIEWGKDDRGDVSRLVIEGKSATNERSLLGEQVSNAILSEAAQHDVRIWKKYLSTRSSRAVMPTTPSASAHWLQAMCEEAQDAELDIEVFEYPPHANPLYDWRNFELAKRQASLRTNGRFELDPWFAEQFLGRWVFYTGRVLPFERTRHVIANDAVDVSTCPVAVSVDYGYQDPSSAGFWAITAQGILVRFDEVYERHLTTPEFVQRIHDRLGQHGVTASYVCGDPSQPQVARLMSESGLHVYDMDRNAQRDRAAGYRRTIDLLTEGPVEGFPGLFVTERCEKTIHEWNHLRHKDKARREYSEGSLEGADHAADDTRYFVMTRPTKPAEIEDRDWLRETLTEDRFWERYGERMGAY